MDNNIDKSIEDQMREILENSTTSTNEPELKPGGLRGWICPVCGAGVSPFMSICPNCSGHNRGVIYCNDNYRFTNGHSSNEPINRFYGSTSTTNVTGSSPKKPLYS